MEQESETELSLLLPSLSFPIRKRTDKARQCEIRDFRINAVFRKSSHILSKRHRRTSSFPGFQNRPPREIYGHLLLLLIPPLYAQFSLHWLDWRFRRANATCVVGWFGGLGGGCVEGVVWSE